MSRKVTKIPQIKQDTPIEAQRLRVAAYCRVSTKHEKQQHSPAPKSTIIQATSIVVLQTLYGRRYRAHPHGQLCGTALQQHRRSVSENLRGGHPRGELRG